MRLLLLLALPAIAASTGYTTYIGDSYPYQVSAITTDSAANTYLTGSRIIEPNPAGTTAAPLTDVFVTKLDPSGNLAATFILAGKNSDQANGIAVDASGNIWVAGATDSPDFPLHNPLQAALGGGRFQTGFLTKLAPDGAVLFSTYFGGTQGGSSINAIAVDASGNVYVTGSTGSPDFAATPGLSGGSASPGLGGHSAAIFAKISAAGDKILYAGSVAPGQHDCGAGSTCWLSEIYNSGSAIAVDPSGSAYIAGNTTSAGLATTPGALRTDGIGAFILKVKPDGSGLVYLTLLGSANYPYDIAADPGNTVTAIAADAAGNAYITGSTSDSAFPATPASFQPAYSIPASQVQMNPLQRFPSDAFAAKLNPSGTAMVWASYLGGAQADSGSAIAVDGSGNVWISGTTSSPDFPASAGVPQGPDFLVEFNSTGSALEYGSRFPANTVATSLAIDPTGVLHAAGGAGLVSAIAPAQSAAPYIYGIANAAGGLVSGRFAPSELITIYGQNFGVANPTQATFDSSGVLPTSLGGVQVTIGGIPAPLLYVSNSQVNAIAPSELTLGQTQMIVTIGGSPLPAFRAEIIASDPQVFTNTDHSAAAINQDGSINSAAHPAPPGSIVSIWATGTGAAGPDGQIDTAAQNDYCCSVSGAAKVTYAGTAPGMVDGVTQINFQLPPSADSATPQYFSISTGAASSDQTFVYVAQ